MSFETKPAKSERAKCFRQLPQEMNPNQSAPCHDSAPARHVLRSLFAHDRSIGSREIPVPSSPLYFVAPENRSTRQSQPASALHSDAGKSRPSPRQSVERSCRPRRLPFPTSLLPRHERLAQPTNPHTPANSDTHHAASPPANC